MIDAAQTGSAPDCRQICLLRMHTSTVVCARHNLVLARLPDTPANRLLPAPVVLAQCAAHVAAAAAGRQHEVGEAGDDDVLQLLPAL